MDKSELEDLLELNNEIDWEDEEWAEDAKEELEVVEEEKFDTYLKTTDWDLAQGTRVVEEMGNGEEPTIQSHSGFMIQNPNYNKESSLHKDITSPYGMKTRADFYAVVYNRMPQIQGPCKDELRHKFMEDLMQLPDYHALHESTKGNLLASDAACTELFKKYSDYLKDQEKRYEVEYNGKGVDVKVNEENQDEFASLAFAADALKAAQEKVEEYEETCKGWGLDPGANSTQDINRIKEMAFITRKNNRVKEIMKRAGRFRRSAQARQREKVIHGQDDMVGVELGGDISRLLPAELAKLTHPLLKKDMMRRLVERQCMQREMRGIEYKEKGPIIVCVDESGSMEGENFYAAKSLALAMVWIARHQKREIALYSFSAGADSKRCFLQKPNWLREEQGDRKILAEWMQHFYAGGTTLDVPLRIVPKEWEEMVEKGRIKAAKTDMIIITDAVVGFENIMRDNFLEWKKRSKCKVITLVLGTEGGRMKEFSDEVHCFQSINVGTEAVNSCFSV